MTKYFATANVLFLLLGCFAAFGEFTKTDYLNENEAPVVIKVPYYEKGAKEPVEMELTLQPGDLYKSRPGKNGLVYEKYGLVEKTFTEFVKKERPTPVVKARDGRDRLNERYEKYLEGQKSEKMPKEWVKEYRDNFSYKLKYVERDIEMETRARDAKKVRSLEKAKAFLQSISSRIDDLEDPASDPDQDGLDNRTEFMRGTNPFLKDYVFAYPMYYEVVYDHSPVVTGTFYLVNSLKVPVKIEWENHLYRFSDFYKLNVSINGRSIPEVIELPAASTNRLDCCFNAEAFPRYFDEAYDIDFYDVTNEYNGASFKVKFHTYEDNSRPLTSPVITKPDKGSLFSGNEAFTCGWEEPEGKAMKKDSSERMHYRVQFVDPFGEKGERDFKIGVNAFVKRHQNLKADEFKQGTYFWRANKQDRFHAPVSSDWSWFAIGREVAPEAEKKPNLD